ncbi:alpha-2-macroglobulin family protein [Flavobacterium rhizosphaerae]|uniref:TonB-dependent receptor plug domain-containing protein n=1 Tax=Flavobacterium rhizosphaerae TaxID=3163298 RepID=A0ABW8YSE4_9FLAO
MKHLIIALIITLSAKAQNFDARWEKVTRLESEGYFKEAAKETNAIYNLAKKKNNGPQLIKGTFFRGKYLQMMEEDAQLLIFKNLRADIKTAPPETAALLESLYAQMLQDVYNRNAYAIRQRTNADGPLPEKFTEWSANHYQQAIMQAFEHSIANRELLYKTPLSDYAEVIDFAPVLAKTNRSLYDFLLEAYAKYLQTVPTNVYLIPHTSQEPLLLGDAQAFQQITMSDSLTVLWPAVKLHHDTETFYLQKHDSLALQRAVLRRLEYTGNAIHTASKTQNLLQTYTTLANRWGDSPFAWRARLQLAYQYRNASSKTTHPEYLQTTIDICNNIIAHKGKHDVGYEAESLKSNIVNSTLRVQTERYITPGKPALVSLNYKNIDSVQVSFYRIKNPGNFDWAGLPHSDFDMLRDSIINHHMPVLTKVYALPKVIPHYNFTTEIALPPLENGCYAVAFGPAGIDAGAENYAVVELQASQMAITNQHEENTTRYFITNRETGKPIPVVAVTTLFTSGLKTDANGRVQLKNDKRGQYNKVIFRQGTDTLYSSYYSYNSSRYEDNTPKASVQVFFDRAIYRPGQKVFFKGIVTQSLNGKYSVAPNVYFHMYAEDASGNDIKEFRLKTNEFGSFTGEFELPKSGMTGVYEFTVEEDEDLEEDPVYNKKENEHPFWDNVDFSEDTFTFRVEDYKRPTFEVSFEPVTKAFALNDSITVTGVAKSFSGARLSGADVEYRLRRTKQQRYSYYYNEDDYDDDELEEYHGGDLIEEEDLETDAQGNFKITFKAEPNSGDDDDRATYVYTIYADVTDINGETHSGEVSIKASATLLFPELAIPAVIDAAKGAEATFYANNANDQKQKVNGTIKIYKKAGNKRILAQRPWAAPEVPIMTEAEFIALFPHLPYTNNKADTLREPQPYLVKEINTGKDKSIALSQFKNWPSGEYAAEFIVKDSLGREEKAFAQFSLVRKNETYLPDNSLYSVRILNNSPAKDGYVELEIRTALPALYGNIIAQINHGVVYDKHVTITNGRIVVKISGVKNPETVMAINFDFVWQNALYTETANALFHLPPDAVEIETETSTSRLAPGREQTWSFTIKNRKNREAELLASMYDTSLDQFTKKDWNGLNTYSYIHDYAPRQEFLTHGTNAGYFTNYHATTSKDTPDNDGFYTYGFSILKSNNEYILYTPRLQVIQYTDITVRGVVTEASTGNPLPGAAVIIAGTSEGVATDLDGKYTLYVAKGEKISFQYIGFEEQTIAPPANGVLNITLKEANNGLLEEVVVIGYGTQRKHSVTGAVTTVTSETFEDRPNVSFIESLQGQVPGLNITAGSGEPGANSTVILRGIGSINGDIQPLYIIDGVPLSEDDLRKINSNEITNLEILKDAAATAIYGSRGANGVIIITTKKGMETLKSVQTRKNFNETAFFFPQLKTDRKGNISFSFTTPEALTEWKLRLYAHNKKAVSGYLEKKFITQKDLMVVPNMPRFLRETDTITLQAKITNLTTEPKSGTAMLQLFDAVTMQPIDNQMLNNNSAKPFNVTAGSSTSVSWTLAVPVGLQGVQYKVVAKAGNFTDGEENILPILPNSMLVTESIPIWVRENTTKTYTFDNIKNNTSATLRHQNITIEYTSNPSWLALRSLPYLMEFEHECSEQLFSRFYANSIANHIITSSPKIAEVFNAWRKTGMPSKLEQNEVLKSIILAETPWLLDEQNQEEQNNRLATLFELDKVRASLEANLNKLADRQKPDGSFPWFPGYDADVYITRHIVAGLGHLQKLGGLAKTDSIKVAHIVNRALPYVDNNFVAGYKAHVKTLKKGIPYRMKYAYSDLHYLYMRSFYLKDYHMSDSLAAAVKPHITYTKQHWFEFSLYEKALAALVMYRYGETTTSEKILTYLKESSANNEELGMYWINNKSGWWWYTAPVETQALLIEAFAEVGNDIKSVDAMRVWLIKQKQNKHWATTKATTEAVYALMMQGSDWLSVKGSTNFTIGSKELLDKKLAETETEAGTGYIKLQWKPEEITSDMATVIVKNNSASPGYGGFYWQYFEDLDKIKHTAEGIMSVKKELYRKNPAAKEITLEHITKKTLLKVGDMVTVRLVVTLTEDAEYVHLKDMRAAAFEPIDVLSGYHYKDGLSYYQSTRDAATNFFFSRISRGTYVLEYDVRLNNSGEFSNGITTIQSMYAPEFSGHTAGVRVKAL